MRATWIQTVLVATFLSAASLPATAQGIDACGEVEAYCFGDQGDCPCGNEYPDGGCANVTGDGGILSVVGDGVVNADNLVFTASQLPAGSPSIFFTTQAAARLPFRNGILCLDPASVKILRLNDPAAASGEGALSLGPGLIALMASVFGPPVGIVDPGSTWYFQNYYRDPGHCVTTANFTNAIRVRFAPTPPLGQTRIGGRIFYDLNESTAYEVGLPGEAAIEGWKVVLDDGTTSTAVFTDALGRFEFVVPMDGAAYELTSVAPPPGYIPTVGAQWLATGPEDVTLVADAPERCVDLGQIYFENRPELARSKGYWHNAGEPLLAACDPVWREVVNGLCLRTNFTNPNGDAGTLFTVSMTEPFDVVFAELSAFLTSPTHGVLAHTLSKQFCATNLNKSCGVLQDTTFVDRFGDGVLTSYEVMFAQTLSLLCGPCGPNSGPHGDQACREIIMGCLDEWDGINSNGTSIYVKSSRKGEFQTPY